MPVQRQLLPILSLFLPMIALVGANTEVFDFLLLKWLDFEHGTYNHGLLLVVIAFYFMWKSAALKSFVAVNWFAVVVCVGFIALVFAANIIHVVFVQVMALYFFLCALIFSLFGWRGLKASFWPLMLLLLALPVWDVVAVVLQEITAEVSFLMIKATGIPVLRDGSLIIIPQGRFDVTPACSGLSYFLAASALAIIYAMMNYTSKRHYLIIISAIILSSIVANWMRVYIVIMAGHFTDMKHPLVDDHFNLGWVLFGVFFIALLFLFNKKLEANEVPASEGSQDELGSSRGTKPLMIPSVLLVVIAVFSAYQYSIEAQSAVYAPDKVVTLNGQQTGGDFSNILEQSLGNKFLGAKEKYYQSIVGAGKVFTYEAFYESQSQGEELVQEGNVFYNGEAWRKVSEGILPFGDGDIGKLVLTSNSISQQVTLFYWYFIDGKRTASDKKAKIYELQSFISGKKGAMAYIVIAENNKIADEWYRSLNSAM